MVWKVVAKSSPGDSDTFGADDIDKYSKLLRGDADVDTCDINSTFGIRHGKGRILSSGGTNPIILNTAATATRTQTFPDETGTIITSATGVTLTGTQTLTNKTISGASNTISNIPSTALPATVVENDQNNDLGDFYVELGDIAAPSDPASGKIRIFLNSATGELSVRKAAGTTVSLEATGGGGGWDPAAAETLTNKTIAFANNTLTNVASLNTAQTFVTAAKTFNSGLLKVRDSDDSHSYTVLGSNLAADRNVTLPLLGGNDTLVTEAHAQTLSAKTLDASSNIIRAHDQTMKFRSTGTGNPDYTIVSPSGTTARNLSIPNLGANDIIAVLAEAQTLTNKTVAFDDNTLTGVASTTTAQTLTNKTMSGASNTFSNIPKGAIPAATLYNDVDNALGTHYADIGEITVPSNPAADVRRIFVNSATGKLSVRTDAGTTVSLEEQPNWSASATETLTNKTIDFDDNTLTDVAGVSATQTLTNKTLTTPIIATIKPDASNALNVPVGNDTLVALTLTQTLTNKTVNFANNTLTGVASTTTAQTLTNKTITYTDNTLTDVASTNTAQTLTNKTIDAAGTGNVLQNVPLYPDKKLWGFWDTTAARTGNGILAGAIGGAPSPADTMTRTVNASGRYVNFASGALADNQGGIRGSSDSQTIRAKNCRYKSKFRLGQTDANTRLYAGFSTSGAAYITGDDPIGTGNGILLIHRTTGTNFEIAHNDGSGACVFDDTGIAKDTGIHTIEIKATEATPKFSWSIDGAAFVDITTDIPAATLGLIPHLSISTATTAAKNFDGWYMMIECDP